MCLLSVAPRLQVDDIMAWGSPWEAPGGSHIQASPFLGWPAGLYPPAWHTEDREPPQRGTGACTHPPITDMVCAFHPKPPTSRTQEGGGRRSQSSLVAASDRMLALHAVSWQHRTLWPPQTVARQAPLSMNSGKDTAVGCHSLLQGIFVIQRSEPTSPALAADSLPLSHLGRLNACIPPKFLC